MDVALLKGRRQDAIESVQEKIEKINGNWKKYKRVSSAF
jgi:hypothetical protein